MTNQEADRRNEQVKQRRMELAAYHCVFRSKHLLLIADAVNMDPTTLVGWIKTPEWQAAIELWEPNRKIEVMGTNVPKAVVKEQRNTKIDFAVFLTVTHGMNEKQIAETLKTTQETVQAWQSTSHWSNRLAYWKSGKRRLEFDDVDDFDAVDDELRKRCENALRTSMPALSAPPITPITFEIDTSDMPTDPVEAEAVMGVIGSLQGAARLWVEMIQEGHDLRPPKEFNYKGLRRESDFPKNVIGIETRWQRFKRLTGIVYRNARTQLRPIRQCERWLHRCLAFGFQVLVLLTFFEV